MFKFNDGCLPDCRNHKIEMEDKLSRWIGQASCNSIKTIYWKKDNINDECDIMITDSLSRSLEDEKRKLANYYGFKVVGNWFKGTSKRSRLHKRIRDAKLLAHDMLDFAQYMKFKISMKDGKSS